jgi:hypothetical protein
MLCIWYFAIYRNSKSAIINYIHKHNTELEQFAESIIRSNDYNTTGTYNEWEVFYWSESNKVEFLVSSRGIVPASIYEGFYYSPDDKPIGFQGEIVEFIVDGTGWKWEERSGDNFQYTEKIIDKWYWFKMSF